MRLAARKLPASISIVPWTEAWQEATGRLIAGAYQNHIDSQINDQYRSAIGARRFLTNIVQYPGCGAFFAPASFAAIADGTLCGVSLAILVSPWRRPYHAGLRNALLSGNRAGVSELVRRSMEPLAMHGLPRRESNRDFGKRIGVAPVSQYGVHPDGARSRRSFGNRNKTVTVLGPGITISLGGRIMSNPKYVPLGDLEVAVQNAVEQALGKKGAVPIGRLWVGFVAPENIATQQLANEIASKVSGTGRDRVYRVRRSGGGGGGSEDRKR